MSVYGDKDNWCGPVEKLPKITVRRGCESCSELVKQNSELLGMLQGIYSSWKWENDGMFSRKMEELAIKLGKK